MATIRPVPVIFTIAGFDPGSGAGVTADLKTIAALGGYGVACLTAVTVQSTTGVQRVEGVSTALIRDTLAALAVDTPPVAIKVGMLHNAAAATAVADFLADFLADSPAIPTVLDPVLRSSSGAELLDSDGLIVLERRLLPLVGWITPNLAEAAVLAGSPGHPINRAEDVPAAAAEIRRRYPRLHIVVTGGHLDRPDDYLLAPGPDAQPGLWIEGEFVQTASTHGTGCAFSTALAVALATGAEAEAAVRAAKDYVTGALRHAVPSGRGRGPLAHFWRAGWSSE